MRRHLLAFSAAALMAAACGSAGLGSGAPPAPTSGSTPTPGSGYSVIVTQADHTATLKVGQRLEVVLRASSGMTNWSHPTSSDTSVLSPAVDPAATAARNVTLAAFVARAPGHATIRSAAGPLCSPGQACPMYAVVFAADITVTS
ncbi:MAG TPA: hypothetical protein VJT78_01510 [Candidatus Dormibacteraeota bacterium]|nr:hypothetical protein [Candidatus Dormibacteraeota bacterium]